MPARAALPALVRAATGVLLSVVAAPAWLADDGVPIGDAPAHVRRLPPGFAPAVDLWTQADEDLGPAWAELAGVAALLRTSRANVSEAESLRTMAVALADVARAEVDELKDGADTNALAAAQYQKQLADAQLAAADRVLESARTVWQSIRAALDLASQKLLRPKDGGASRDPYGGENEDEPIALPEPALRWAAARSAARPERGSW